MKQVIARDQAALEVLYDRYGSSVMGLAMKMVSERKTAEDIVQEAFWRVWRNADSYRAQSGSVSSWLFGITRNLAIDTLRRQKSRPRTMYDSDAPNDEDTKADPKANVAESAWTAIKYKQVRTAMRSLPPPQRQVIVLAYFRGLTRQEIAEHMNLPLGTVHTRARLALKKLRAALAEQGFEE
jgi:RNA polymerase sigma-70 factor (ECF subfamily)